MMADTAAASPIRNVTTEEVRALLDGTRLDALTLLDVRMEPEYAEFHLPGARLLPLPDLPDHLGELDRDKPVVVYCRSGMRSAAASRLLAGAGFPRVLNMLGGATAWQGAAATGPPDTGLTLLSGHETPTGILLAAIGMEAALGAFYTRLGQAAPDSVTRETFTRLAGFEERHLHHVHGLYRKASGDETGLDTLLTGAAPELEGGQPGEAFLAQLGGSPESPQEALELAASVEAQALDLYARLATLAEDPASVSLLVGLAQEEKAHLRVVAALIDRLATPPNA